MLSLTEKYNNFLSFARSLCDDDLHRAMGETTNPFHRYMFELEVIRRAAIELELLETVAEPEVVEPAVSGF